VTGCCKADAKVVKKCRPVMIKLVSLSESGSLAQHRYLPQQAHRTREIDSDSSLRLLHCHLPVKMIICEQMHVLLRVINSLLAYLPTNNHLHAV